MTAPANRTIRQAAAGDGRGRPADGLSQQPSRRMFDVRRDRVGETPRLWVLGAPALLTMLVFVIFFYKLGADRSVLQDRSIAAAALEGGGGGGGL
jgi:hypothetical protein